MVSAMLAAYVFVGFQISLALKFTADGCSETLGLDMLSQINGTALIVGANVGDISTDPSWRQFISRKFDHFDKVYIEPHPGLFKKLAQNIKTMPRAKALRAAVTDASGPMTLYCLGIDENGDLTPEARDTKGFEEWWTQICSGSRDRLMSNYDVQLKQDTNITDLVVEINVPTISAAKLLEDVPSPVQYVQIDVEGFDDTVMMSFPFSDGSTAARLRQDSLAISAFHALFKSASFRPLVVTFEYVLLGDEKTDAAINFLKKLGYETCFERQNVVGIFLGA